MFNYTIIVEDLTFLLKKLTEQSKERNQQGYKNTMSQ